MKPLWWFSVIHCLCQYGFFFDDTIVYVILEVICLHGLVVVCPFYTRSEGPLAEADAWGDDDNEYYNDRPDARPPSPHSSSKAPLAEYATPPSNLPVSACLLNKTMIIKSMHIFKEM
jgi:hypothetical protein